jgi:hypothetical protein
LKSELTAVLAGEPENIPVAVLVLKSDLTAVLAGEPENIPVAVLDLEI